MKPKELRRWPKLKSFVNGSYSHNPIIDEYSQKIWLYTCASHMAYIARLQNDPNANPRMISAVSGHRARCFRIMLRERRMIIDWKRKNK